MKSLQKLTKFFLGFSPKNCFDYTINIYIAIPKFNIKVR